jgi:hypothetical protein
MHRHFYNVEEMQGWTAEPSKGLHRPARLLKAAFSAFKGSLLMAGCVDQSRVDDDRTWTDASAGPVNLATLEYVAIHPAHRRPPGILP